MLDAALDYAAAGIPVVPLHSVRDDGTCTCGRPDCPSPGKHPRTRNGLKDATTQVGTIRKWWSNSQWPNASIAGVGGEHLCLDVDIKKEGMKSLARLISDNAPLPDTAVALTGEYKGERGRHYWFAVPDGRRVASKVGVRKGIDIRCARGYAVLPPSRHYSGVQYEWEVEFEELSDAPEWLLDLAPEAVEGDSHWEPPKGFKMAKEKKEFLSGTFHPDPGEQRLFLCAAARSVLSTGKTIDQTTDLLWDGYDGQGGICACDWDEDPWTYEQILYLVETEFRSSPPTPMEKDFEKASQEDLARTDIANARRLISTYPESHLVHVMEWGKWYIWDDENKKFIEDDGTELTLRWEQETEKMFGETADKEKTGPWVSHVRSSRSRGKIESCLSLTRHMVRINTDSLNADQFVLCCKNGALNLKTGELLDTGPEHLLTKQVRASYNPKAKSKLWDRVLQELIPDRELRKFVQKVFGYTLTGSIEENKFFYFHGPPGAGKTTLLEAFSFLMGNYSEACEPSTFMQKRNEGGPTEDIARLSNARMVVTHEVEEGSRWAEGRISHLTGGDKINARFLHQNSFDFYPKFKLFFSANHKPRVSGSSQSGLWRRLVIVPIDRVIPEEERDPMLLRKLRQQDHLDAMLAWAVEGCKMWMEDYNAGRLMEVPQLVKDEVDEYKRESDHVLEFIEEMVIMTDSDKDRLPKPDLYGAYRAWCNETGRRQFHTSNKLTRELNQLGYKWKPAQIDGKVRDCWMGVRIKGLPRRRHEVR